MSTGKALIWDLDGILINSYPIMLSCLKRTLLEKDIRYNIFEILDYIQTKSVMQFIEKISFIHNLSAEELWGRYLYYEKIGLSDIKLLPSVKEVLERLQEVGIKQYVYTHRGEETKQILDRFELSNYFTEIIANAYGIYGNYLPDGIKYLLDKYHLMSHEVYYIGYRPSDVECAYYANINSIIYFDKQNIKAFTMKPHYFISDLLELESIFEESKLSTIIE